MSVSHLVPYLTWPVHSTAFVWLEESCLGLCLASTICVHRKCFCCPVILPILCAILIKACSGFFVNPDLGKLSMVISIEDGSTWPVFPCYVTFSMIHELQGLLFFPFILDTLIPLFLFHVVFVMQYLLDFHQLLS